MLDALFAGAEPIVVVTGQRYPEGPSFDTRGALFVCNRWDGFIAKVQPDGHCSRYVATGGKPNGSRFHRDGRLFIADIGRREILAADPAGALTVVVDAFDGQPLLGPNDLIFDHTGALYFTDPGLGAHDAPGRVFRWTPDGSLSLLVADLLYPNGIALSADERSLYVAETGANRVSRFALGADGAVGKQEILAQFEDGIGPDGIAFAADGRLFVTHRGTGTVIVLDPAGRVTARLPAGGALPTNLAFWGTSLYVTEDESAAVHRLNIGIRGLPLYHQRKD